MDYSKESLLQYILNLILIEYNMFECFIEFMHDLLY